MTLQRTGDHLAGQQRRSLPQLCVRAEFEWPVRD
jgi:hypothetical protein